MIARPFVVTSALLLALGACGPTGSSTSAETAAADASATSPDAAPAPLSPSLPHSGPIVASADGARIFVAHPDADSVTIVDAASRAVVHETLLAAARPALDPATHRYDPAVEPRSIALDPAGARLYATGQRSGRVYALDAATGALVASADACAEPVGVLVAPDGARVYVACSQDDAVIALDARDLATVGRVATARKPWSLAWGADGALIATHLLGPGLSIIDPSTFTLRTTFAIPDGPPSPDGNARVPHGQVRGIYDAAVRPGTHELWVLHMMLGTDTAQPALDFQSTVFPAITVLDEQGNVLSRLTVSVSPEDGGALGDVVSGPRALAFAPDGRFAFVADASSEDVLTIDAARRVEASLLRPLPGHLPEGLVATDAGATLYVDQRNTEDLAVLRVDADGAATVDGAAVPSLARDPMPADLRLGQKLFFSSNSDDVPVTRDHWVACASCHLEGRSDAVTWRFAQGPRDTPSNAGGTLDTGFLFRSADRTRVQDYWRTIDTEQGGHFAADVPAQAALLDALEAYVDHAIPAPIAPRTDATLRARGAQAFVTAGCASCHAGPAFTDSGAGNPALDLAGVVVLHDVGTCNHGAFPDVAHADVLGDARGACAFDTPSLRGLADSAPYLHDGSAATLDAVLAGPSEHVGGAAALGADDLAALREYLRSL